MAEVYLAWTPAAPGEGSARARGLLKQLYESVTGQPMPELRKTEKGKPFFSHGPWQFSLSHSKKAAFCALSLLTVGLDVEPLSRKISPGLPEKTLHPREFSRFLEQGGDNRLFLTCWVLKEAYGKWTGEGLTPHRLNRLNFSLENPECPVLEGSELSFRTLELAGHILALCTGEPPRIHLREFES